MINDKNVDPAQLRAGILHFDTALGLKLAETDDMAKDLYRKELGEIVEFVVEVPNVKLYNPKIIFLLFNVSLFFIVASVFRVRLLAVLLISKL